MDVLYKMFVQIILAAKWLVQHSSTYTSFSFFHAEILEYYLNGWNVRLNYNRDIVFIQVFSTKVPKFGCTAISHCSKLDRVNFFSIEGGNSCNKDKLRDFKEV